jgi:hypothetical protein
VAVMMKNLLARFFNPEPEPLNKLKLISGPWCRRGQIFGSCGGALGVTSLAGIGFFGRLVFI